MNYYSSEDMLGLVAEINEKRLPRITGDLIKRAGGVNPLNPREVELLKSVRHLHHRFAAGELTHSDNDESRVKQCMDWLISKHAELKSQPARLDYEWDPRRLRRSEPLVKTFYAQALAGTRRW